MTSFAGDPARVHEFLATLLVALLVPGVVLAIAYLRTLDKFFAELQLKEPQVWVQVGSPRLVNMLLLPFQHFRKFYAFLFVLRERAADTQGAYRYAAPAYRLLKAGLAFALFLLSIASVTVFWIVYHGL